MFTLEQMQHSDNNNELWQQLLETLTTKLEQILTS